MFKTGARTALIIIAALTVIIASVQAQQVFNVVEIEVVGNRVASKSLILGVSSIAIGSPLTPIITGETITRLYGLGIFSDVQINAEEVMGGLKVYIIVKELPKLSGLEIEGNSKIDTKDIKEELGLGVGGYISPYLIEKKRGEVKAMYGEKGFFQATIKSELEYSPDSTEAILRYKVDEKSKVKVQQVILTGNDRVPDEDIIDKMRNRKRGFLRSSDFAQDKYAEDLEKIIDEFHKRGFIDAYLVSDSISIDTSINRMTIYLDVYEGPRYYFGNVNFRNNAELSANQLRKSLKYDEGDVFNVEKYNESFEQLYSAYYDIGHLNMRMFDERITRNDSLIDITYDIVEGLPSKINLVRIVGNTKTKDKVIRREITSLPGQRFSRELLIRSIREVMALNYFANVVPTPINLPSGDVDVEFKVEEKQTGQISAGAGYNSQDKVVGQLGVGIPNFRGMGQSLSFNTEFGSNRNSLSVSFTEPWLFGRPTLMGSQLYTLNRRWFGDYTEGRQGGSIRLGRRLRWPDNYFRVFTSYRLERARYHDFDDDFVGANSYQVELWVTDESGQKLSKLPHSTLNRLPFPGSILQYNEEWNSASRISFTVQRDSRNLPEFATSGSKLSYTFENTGGPLGGFWKYQKHSIEVAKFIPLFWNFALAAKVQYGVVTSPGGDDSRILLSDRFTPGGTAFDGIIRGYEDGSLTPDSVVNFSDTLYWYTNDVPDFEGDIPPPPDSITVGPGTRVRVRGKYMLVSNIELQFPVVSQQVYALLFFDAGNSWLRKRDIRFDDLYRGVGFGFRIVVPGIGTLGFDLAYSLDQVIRYNPSLRGYEVTQPRGWKPHFQIGTTFR
ncbi:MAG: outer membrane protein assembly factor BamA [Candidatus Zixiibacteriota bacterium]|nr:MAG: outer membrane protein assembly factor BamA [candidate division Zixibacteria bacterium]